MRRHIIWELRYDRTVTAFLYSLRGSETGTAIHDAIKNLQFVDHPSTVCDPVPERTGYYRLTLEQHNILIEVLEGDRKIIIVLDIEGMT